MYFNHAAMSEVARLMKCPHFNHYNESGMIVASIGIDNDASIAFTQKNDSGWSVYASRNLVGKINFPHYYWTHNVAAYFDAVCWAVYEDRKEKVEQMINPPLDSMIEGYGRLAAMAHVPMYETHWNADSESDAFGIVWSRVGDSDAPRYNFTPNYPEDGVAQFVVLDKYGNELNFALFDWMYGNDDVVAYMQTARAMITFCDPRLTEGAQLSIEEWEKE